MFKIKIQTFANFVDNLDNAVHWSHMNVISLSILVINNGNDYTMHHNFFKNKLRPLQYHIQ
jgi:hypothetical protein